MNNAANPYQSWGTLAAQADTSDRARFIRLTYLHLAGAVLAFIGIEAALLNSPLAETMTRLMMGNGQLGWLVVLAAFMGVSWIANKWATSATSMQTQYMGLGLYVVAQAVITLPLLYMASLYGGPNVILNAGILTAVIFIGLTGLVLATGANLSFIGTALGVAGIAAMGVILCSALFGFNLGIVFIAAMIVLACGYILYDTSNVLHQYRIGQHVAASLALFAAVVLLFWYILQLLMSLNRR